MKNLLMVCSFVGLLTFSSYALESVEDNGIVTIDSESPRLRAFFWCDMKGVNYIEIIHQDSDPDHSHIWEVSKLKHSNKCDCGHNQ